MSGRLVIVGDILLDVDLEGAATRVMPDAPVPVLDDLVESARPGGAGLAALMAAAEGQEVILVTAIGDDPAGARVSELLEDVPVVRLPHDGATPVKQRVRAAGQSLLRLDSGTQPATVGPVSSQLGEELESLLGSAGAVLVADYGRGVTAEPSVRHRLARAATRVPMTWDPHPRGSVPVPGVKLATPNESEAAQLAPPLEAGSSRALGRLAAVGRRAEALQAAWRAQGVAVTLGAQGALLTYGDGAPMVVPAPAVQCVDACGAGDRFATSAALALGRGLLTSEAVQQAVREAAAYVAAGGPRSLARPDLVDPHRRMVVEDLVAAVSSRGGTVVATGGCFDLLHAGHVATLRAARALGDCLVVCLNSDDSVRRLKGPSRPLVPASDRARVLEALECVDAVVEFEEDTPVEVLDRIRPHVWAKGGDYAGAEVPEAAVLREWGGQVVALPYLEGRSTTSLVAAAAARSGPGRPDGEALGSTPRTDEQKGLR